MPDDRARLRRRRVAAHRRDRGGALMEFVLLMPLFLLLITMSFDLGRLAFINGSLELRTAAAAREPAMVGATGADVEAIAQSAFAGAGTLSAGGEYELVGASGSCTLDGNHITAEAEASMSFMTPGLAALFGGAVDDPELSTSVSAACEVVR